MVCVWFFLCFFGLSQAQFGGTDDDFCQTPDDEAGSCISVLKCQTMLDALDQVPHPFPPEIQNYLSLYRCGFEGRIPKVCCPFTPINLNNKNKETFPQQSEGHRNIRLLPKNCGYLDTDNKIVNGQKAALFEFPWMSLLSYRTKTGPQFKCGGTIINNRYILTAAHCLTNLKTPLLGVRVGEHNIKTAKDCETNKFEGEVCAPPYQDLAIEKIITHPEYNARHFTNDIGLIRVSPINLNLENSRPVCLPLGENQNFNFTNRNAIVTGWGVTEKGVPSPVLLKVSLPVVPLQECRDKYKTAARIDDRQLCAGGKNKDSCAGDSGGPLHALGRVDGEERLVQQGIVSFGPNRCGETPVPGVYTKVAAFMDWILDNIEQ